MKLSSAPPILKHGAPEGTFDSFGSEIKNTIVIEINTTVVMVRKPLEINPIVINDLIRSNSCRCCPLSPSSIQSASSLASEISEMHPIKCLSFVRKYIFCASAVIEAACSLNWEKTVLLQWGNSIVVLNGKCPNMISFAKSCIFSRFHVFFAG